MKPMISVASYGTPVTWPLGWKHIASGASGTRLAHQVGYSRIETTKNIYGHLFSQARAFVLEAMNLAVRRLYAYEDLSLGRAKGHMQLPDRPQTGLITLQTVGLGSRLF